MELDELTAINRSLQQGAVAATIQHMRRRLPSRDPAALQRTMTIACLEGSAVHQAAAVLVAAAMQPSPVTPVAAGPQSSTEGVAVSQEASAEHMSEAAADAQAVLAADQPLIAVLMRGGSWPAVGSA